MLDQLHPARGTIPAIGLRGLECAALFFCVPVGLAVLRWKTGCPLFPFLGFFFVFCLIALLKDQTFDRGDLFRAEALRRGWKKVAARFVLLAAVLTVIVLVLKPAPLFAFAREQPLPWLVFVLFFPLLPAYPEELVFRVFFSHRYRSLFTDQRIRIAAGALSFSLAHLHLANAWALTLSFIGGLLFAGTFERSRSAALATLEHALWGIFLFTLGLGPFFHRHLALPR